MELSNQIKLLKELKKLADNDVHSMLLQGIAGSGKTYMVNKFAQLKNITNINLVEPKVNSLKTCFEYLTQISENSIVCIENLDTGVNAASQTILKYLEEPLPHVYIVVTCLNEANLPSTIISRCVTTNLFPPSTEDLEEFSTHINQSRTAIVKDYAVFNCCKSLSDIKYVLSLTTDQLNYYEQFTQASWMKNSIDSLTWNLGHFSDNSKTNLNIVFRIIFNYTVSKKIKNSALSCLLDLELGRLSETAILSNFVINSII